MQPPKPRQQARVATASSDLLGLRSLLGELSLARLALSLGLLAALVGVRFYELPLYGGLEASWQRLGQAWPAVAALDRLLAPVATLARQGGLYFMPASAGGAAVLIYALAYVGLCLALLRALLPTGQGWRWGLGLYAGLGGASLLLLLASQLTGVALLATLASRLWHPLFSPLPVLVLVPLLRWAATQPVPIVQATPAAEVSDTQVLPAAHASPVSQQA